MKKSIENYAYDIVLNDFKQLGLYLYKVVDTEIFSEHGRRDYYREYFYMGYEFPEDLPARIQDLNRNGFYHMNQFKKQDIEIIVHHPLIALKLLALSKNHKILEKVYYTKIIQDMSYLVSYVTCVNMKSGEVSLIEVANHGLYSTDTVQNLEDSGYISIVDSFGYHLFNLEDQDQLRKK